MFLDAKPNLIMKLLLMMIVMMVIMSDDHDHDEDHDHDDLLHVIGKVVGRCEALR